MVDCWRIIETWPGCGINYYVYVHADISNTIDNPALYIPDYIVKSVGYPGCATSGGPLIPFASELARARWSAFCSPPLPTPFPLISTGQKVLDISHAPSTNPVTTFELSKGNAIACRFIPTFVCLPYIVLHDIVNTSPNTTARIIVEIREEDPNSQLPKGTLKDINTSLPDDNIIARAAVDVSARSQIATGGRTMWIENYNVAVPINAILNSLDTPHWIVIYSEDFVCGNAFLGSVDPQYNRVKFSTTTEGANNFAVFSQSGQTCGWGIESSVPNLSFATYKTISCEGVIVINDFGFAIDNQFVLDNCFKSLTEVKNKDVIIGIRYTAPRILQRIRFDIAYRRPNGTYFVGSTEVTDTAFGSNEVFINAAERYMPGIELEYKELSVGYEVLQV